MKHMDIIKYFAEFPNSISLPNKIVCSTFLCYFTNMYVSELNTYVSYLKIDEILLSTLGFSFCLLGIYYSLFYDYDKVYRKKLTISQLIHSRGFQISTLAIIFFVMLLYYIRDNVYYSIEYIHKGNYDIFMESYINILSINIVAWTILTKLQKALEKFAGI